MPINVFVDFFSSTKLRMTKSMIVVQNVGHINMLQCVDEGWDVREEGGVLCKLEISTVCCKYMIANQNFILTFYYRRWQQIGATLVPLEQDMEDLNEDSICEFDLSYNNCVIFNIAIRKCCTLRQLRTDILYEDLQLPDVYVFIIDGRKVHFLTPLITYIFVHLKF